MVIYELITNGSGCNCLKSYKFLAYRRHGFLDDSSLEGHLLSFRVICFCVLVFMNVALLIASGKVFPY